MSDFPTARWCRSRRAGAVCTRPAGHPGLHNRMGTGQMWSDREADPPRCEGSGTTAVPAEALADGFPDGRALCPVCLGFEPVRDGALVEHDAFRGAGSAEEAARRAEWFNTFGWTR
ncbi:hypothetical protein ABZ477_00525 [Microbacterium sp. NPDC019599]|uniref:hypothetical protein n=1 Tax=Microbacterium sp. NPDC019599 TaxID=3154690 RepID=UPI0033E4D621